jgi:Tat protein translocase TatB subunit
VFNIGTAELLVIAAAALIILGPEKFPTQAKVFLRMLREFREHWDDAKRDIMNEINPVKKEFRELTKYKPEDLLDRLTGETQDDEPSEGASSNSRGMTDAGVANTVPATGANEAPADFDSGMAPPVEGRSEDTQWKREEVPTASATLTEEDEYRAAEENRDPRMHGGSD